MMNLTLQHNCFLPSHHSLAFDMTTWLVQSLQRRSAINSKSSGYIYTADNISDLGKHHNMWLQIGNIPPLLFIISLHVLLFVICKSLTIIESCKIQVVMDCKISLWMVIYDAQIYTLAITKQRSRKELRLSCIFENFCVCWLLCEEG